MSAWTTTVLSLCAAYWSALFAQVAHLRMLEDGVGAAAFGRLSMVLLAASTALFVATIGT